VRELKSRKQVIPEYFDNDKLRDRFIKNLTNKESNLDYKKAKEDLEAIHYNKCVYCESKFKNDYMEIEHYRPKKSDKNIQNSYAYYWLYISFENLIASCKKCNLKKKNSFDIKKDRAVYQNEPLDDLHFITSKYNEIEKPLLIHPEVDENFEKDIKINKLAELESDSERVIYTIRTCNLNRENLKEARGVVIEDFKRELEDILSIAIDFIELDKLDRAIDIFKAKIDKFDKKSSIENEYSFVRVYILENIDEFLDWFDIKDREIFEDLVKLSLEEARIEKES